MWKRLLTFFFISLCFFGKETVMADEETYYVQVEGVVNLRSEPTTNAPIVVQLKNNMPVTLIKTEGEWSYLSYEGMKGYLKNEFLVQKEEVDTDVTNFFYHTFGYHTVNDNDTIENLAFISKMPKEMLFKINAVENATLEPQRILKMNTTQPLKGKKIVLDPGHGGNEAGASANGVKEGEETLALGLVVKRHLEREGATVIMTVDENIQGYRRVTLRERAHFTAKYDANLFVSLHYNMNGNKNAEGAETYYNRTPFKGESNPFPDESERLANYLQQYTVASLGSDNLGTKDNEYHVLRNNTVPSVLMEVAFLSNEKEAKRLQTTEFKEKAAFGITQGIIHYYQ